VFEALRRDQRQVISVYFFGGPAGASEAAAHRINAEAAGMRCVGYECPGFGSVEEMSDDSTIERINASGADFLVVALGARKGQAWIERNRARLATPVISHLGAVINFVAGSVQRAPRWMQRSGLEWVWRIKEEPALWRRYWHDGRALMHLLGGGIVPFAMRARDRSAGGPDAFGAQVHVSRQAKTIEVRLAGVFTHRNLAGLRDAFRTIAEGREDVLLDLGQVSQVDSAFVGLVVLLAGDRSRQGARLDIKGLRTAVHTVFEGLNAGYLFARRAP
jgi:N-acetylglucosaminyldiphosphoundecaprenol N-acetyl-beta-D-mannosaminyltransferase